MKVIFAIFTIAIMTFAAFSQTPKPQVDSEGYLIGPGDEITGKVLGEPQFDFVATVDENGQIQVPFSDSPVVAKCQSERGLRKEVNDVLAKYLRNPQLSLRVTERKSRPPATIYGEVRTPQQVVLMRKATLLELIAFSGDVTEQAGGTVQVFRTQPPLCDKARDEDANWKSMTGDPGDVPSRVFSLNEIKQGLDEANPIIYPGDVIVVQKAPPVYITGEVVQPQGVFLKEGGLSLTEAIAKIGGVRREAKTKDIKIYRLKKGSKDREIISANYDLIKKGEQKDVMLEPYDIVEVDKSKKSIAQTILDIVTGASRTALSSVGNGLGTRVLY